MSTNLSSASADWILPSYPTSFTSTLPNYEDSLPFRVNHEGVQNYVKNRGSLNIGDWAIEGRQMSSAMSARDTPVDQDSYYGQPKVLGPDALRNYNKGRRSSANLIYGTIEATEPQNPSRVRREGQANYDKSHSSQVKNLLQNYGKLSLPAQQVPHTQGQVATNLFYTHQRGHMANLLSGYDRADASPRPIPHVKGEAAELNRQRARGTSQLTEHGVHERMSTPEPHLSGVQAHSNYDFAQGRRISQLFHQYGKVPLSARPAAKVAYDGVDNRNKSQGDAMRKTISQCPRSSRYIERPQSVPSWP